MFLGVFDTSAMTDPAATVAARRARLSAWIQQHHEGKQASFVRATKINQGELSGLLGSKSFGEKRASAIERAAGMPDGYLVRPLAEVRPARLFQPGATSEATLEGKVIRLEGDILNLRIVLNAVLAALVRSTPAVASDVGAILEETDGRTHGYLADALHQIHEAQETMATEQLSALRHATPSGAAKRR